MAGVAAAFQPFKLGLTQPGAFPNLRQPQTLWLGLGGDTDILSRLHRRLEAGLKDTGYKPENQAFAPHLTLARLRDEASPACRQRLGEAASNPAVTVSGLINVTAINLMQSRLTPAGAVYSRLFSAVFDGGEKTL
jgi:2'-5' RNA ligase